MGPHTANFAEAVAALQAAGGLAAVDGVPALADWVGTMLRDPAQRARMGEAAMQAASGHVDLPRQTADALIGLML